MRIYRPTLLGALAFCLLLGSTSQAEAASEGPGWMINARSVPTNFAPGGKGTIVINVFNIGAAAAGCTEAQRVAELEAEAAETAEEHGLAAVETPLCPPGSPTGPSPITVTDVLPPGVTAREAGELGSYKNGLSPAIHSALWDCSGNGPGGQVAGASVVTCTNVLPTPGGPRGLGAIPGGGGTPHTFGGPPEGPNLQPRIGIAVNAPATESLGLANHVTISGGNAPSPAAGSDPINITSAEPPFGFTGFDGWFSNADGTVDTVAGSHPYELTFNFDLASVIGEESELFPAGGEARDVEIAMPPGIVGDPGAVAQCTSVQLTAERCPAASQVGTVNAYFTASFPQEVGFSLYNMVPPPGTPVLFGFTLNGIQSFIDAKVRTGSDYGITTTTHNIGQRLISGAAITIWGYPSEASHNRWRLSQPGGCKNSQREHPEAGSADEYCLPPSVSSTRPFLTLPTSCGRPLPFTIRAQAWENPALRSEKTFLMHDSSGNPTTITGCEKLEFSPSLTATPEKAEADSPTGLTAVVTPPLGGLQEQGLFSTSNLNRAVVTLPEGLIANPGQAAGLQACTPQQANLTTSAEAGLGLENAAAAVCPAASRLGTAVVKSPLLATAVDKQLEGGVYLMQSNPPELKLLIAASGDGINVKQLGTVHLDEATGRITATFEENPQLPFSSFELAFNSGAHAALVTPPTCGSYEAGADFRPWASPLLPDHLTGSAFAISSGSGGTPCPSKPLPFTPRIAAGAASPVAGASSAFELEVSKPDDQQNIRTIETTLPPGQLAKLAGIPLCPDTAAASGNCPAASQIGSVSAAVGPGANPLAVPQPGKAPTVAYLGGPYKGAPYSLVVKVPAQAGPFDLGTVTTRAALYVDPNTTEVTAKSDPLPQILDGVKLSYQSISVNVDRPNFILNPTNCDPMKVTGTIGGSEGASAKVSNPYKVEACNALGFKPKLALSLKGPTKRGKFPTLRAVLRPRAGDANSSRISVALPHSEFLAQEHIRTVCTRVQFNAGAGNGSQCPAASIYGHARAFTPILSEPLEGPVFLRSSSNPLPDLVLALHGAVDFDAVGRIDSVNGGIRNTFDFVPDAPITKVVVDFQGGKKSLLVNSTDLCRSTNRATVKFDGQNGKAFEAQPELKAQCPKARKGHKKGKHKH